MRQAVFVAAPLIFVPAGMERGAGSDQAKATLADPRIPSRGSPLPGKD